MNDLLPVSLTPRPGQSIESWLEHLADANGISTANLLTLVRGPDGRRGSRYLTLAPSAEIVARLARAARVPERAIRESSLAGFDGVGIDLTGLDHDDRDSYRAVAARGWAPAHGTQICPGCLANDGAWRTVWRLLIVTACTTHGTNLIASCPSCGRPFRDQRHSHLRRVGAATVCGNPLGQGPVRQCKQDLTTVASVPADPAVLALQVRVDMGLDGRPVIILGQLATAAAYLNDLKHLTTLLLHLAAQPAARHLIDWTGDLAVETAQRTVARGPRWRMRPPDNPILRRRALAAADAVLAGTDLDDAAQALVPWIELTPRTIEGPLGWLADRTVMTPTMTRLVMAARAPHRRLSHHLDAVDPTVDNTDRVNGDAVRLDTRQIPQVIPHLLYREHLVGAFDSSETTVRLFASLCVARMDRAVTSWAEAAEALDLPPAIGVRTARARSASMLIDKHDWTDRLYRVATDLPRRDYRALEAQVRHLAHSSRWFDEWRRDCRPGTRDASKAHALNWLWAHVAHGHLDTATGWEGKQPTARQRARYRQFEASLDAEQRTRLAQTLDEPATGTPTRTPSTTGSNEIGETP
jgi:hypothetical protein